MWELPRQSRYVRLKVTGTPGLGRRSEPVMTHGMPDYARRELSSTGSRNTFPYNCIAKMSLSLPSKESTRSSDMPSLRATDCEATFSAPMIAISRSRCMTSRA